MKGGYAGKMLFVDLSAKTVEEKPLSDELAVNFIGGYGIGARVLYDLMPPGADPLGPESVLGFVSGVLNGTGALFGGRYTVVCKSPVTGGWNDANSGGFFGPEMKNAGFDAVFVSGVSPKPVYLYIKDGKAEIRDATALWGKDCTETEEALIRETGEKGLRAAMIGAAGERLSLISCVMNDKHRAAGRGGCGAVMGSKKLKAVAVRGSGKILVADPAKVKEVNRQILDWMKNGPTVEVLKAFGSFGTGVGTGGSGMTGDAPIKNWGGVGAVDMGEERLMNLSTFAYDARYNTKKYACANCPLGCGAHYKVADGRWRLDATDRPEYETLGAFGTMTLNDNVESIIKCNDICNRYGLDTISVGATIAWAIECYENGLFSRRDTDGIALTWGNGDAIVAMTQAIADKTGFGKMLSLGSAKAAERLGKGAEYLQTVQGIELPMHDPRNSPGFSRTYQYDPTPARHVKGGLGLAGMNAPVEVKYAYEGKGQQDALATYRTEVVNASGLCLFGADFGIPPTALANYIAAATGQPFDDEETSLAGKRILTMRHAFNLREGINARHDPLPKRCVGEPPLADGPLKGVTVDHRNLANQFFENVGWDRNTLIPSRESLKELGIEDVAKDIGC
jgi:aldehyde:ferredoxin oxidoreductase